MDKRTGHRGVKIGEAGPTVAPGGEEGTGETRSRVLDRGEVGQIP